MNLRAVRWLPILLLLAMLLAPLLARAGTTPSGDSGWVWSIETVDSAGAVGTYASLKLDAAGHPHIAYYDAAGILKYAYHDGTAWQIEVVDGTASVGQYASLALDASGMPWISYFDATNGDLRLARKQGFSWIMQTVDAAGAVGRWSSLAFDAANIPHIAYHAAPGAMRLAYFVGIGGNCGGGGWYCQTIVASGVGGHISLALAGSGWTKARIAYYDSTGGDLRYLYYRDPEIGWVSETVDGVGDVGQYASLVLDEAGLPRIAYYDATNGDLKLASFNGASWQLQTVDSTGNVGQYASLVLDEAGLPRIAYYDVTNGDLKLASFDGASWQLQTVDGAGNVGQFASLALDSLKRAHIAYYDLANGDLRYAFACVRVSFTHTPSAPICVGPVFFQSVVEGETPLSYAWDFGDGGTSTDPNPMHIYASQGRYPVSLAVTTVCSTAVATETLEVWDVPRAGFTYAPDPVCGGDEVFFTNTTVGSGTLSFFWDFGDGETSNEPDPVHQFVVPGVYEVQLLALNECGYDIEEQSLQVHGAPALAPSWEPITPEIHTVVTFSAALSSTLPPSTPAWDFGDGGIAFGNPVTHIYHAAGRYTVTVGVGNACGQVEEAFPITVVCYEPHDTSFSWEPVQPPEGGTVQFHAQSRGSAPLSFAWDFGDGETGSGENPIHTYQHPGWYTVTLTVSNDCGFEVVSHALLVCTAPSGAQVFHSPEIPAPGEETLFVAVVDGSEPLSYAWDFGDGGSGSGQNVRHTYQEPGWYTVTMTASNACGVATASEPILVCAAPAGLEVAYSPAHPVPGETIHFSATLSAGSVPISFLWTFDDGYSASSPFTSHAFATVGDHRVEVEATNACGALSRAITVTVSQPRWSVYLPVVTRMHLVDVFEPDNTPSQARLLEVGTFQWRTLNPAGDRDWAYLILIQGQSYRLETGNLGPNTDTILEVYAGDGTTLLASNDDCTPYTRASCVTFVPPATGRYYVQVRDYLPTTGGPDHVYRLLAQEGMR